MELKKEYFVKVISKKRTALVNAEYIRIMAENIEEDLGKDYKHRLLKRANRIVQCLNYWEWDKYEKNKILDLRKIYRCKDLFCPNCRSWNSAKSIIKFMPYFSDMLLKGYSPYFMTLTVPNIPGNDLGTEIDKLNKGYSKIWRWLSRKDRQGFKSRLFQAVGSIRVIELTVNRKNRSFNVHIHAIIFLDKYYTNEFLKIHSGGYRIKSKENIFYSDADIFIQKLWTMAYKDISIREFDKMSDNWKDNYICDIRELDMPGGIYETFKYCFKDVNIMDIDIFQNIFFGLMDRRLRQSYGLLFKLDKEISNGKDEMESEDLLQELLKIEEEPEILRIKYINEMLETYKNYKKISRYKSDKEYQNIRE